ncbi:MAG: SDR family oxidoreductase [Bacteroidota bacterium]
MGELLKGKCIVIVGGTSGIGLSAAKAFAKEGAQILATGLPVEDLPNSDRILFQFVDATHEGSAEEGIQTCLSQFGDFHALYHVAGGSGRKFGDGPLHEMTFEGWKRTLALNLDSVMLSNRAAVQYFLQNGTKGAILNTSTVLAYHPSPKYFYTHAYAAAKAAIIGFSQSLAAYYAPHNIRVNVIAPALTQTPMAQRAAKREDIQQFIQTKQPLEGGRMAYPEDLDGAALYLLSDAARFTTGQVLAVDGGWSVSEGQYGL